jgi:hypothetical protein
MRDTQNVNCPVCGQFEVTNTALADNAREIERNRWKISAWLQENSRDILNSIRMQEARDAKPPGVHSRAHRMLSYLVKHFPPGTEFSIADLGKTEPAPGMEIRQARTYGKLLHTRLQSIGWNKDIQETIFMITDVLCDELGFLVHRVGTPIYRISPKGLLQLEKQTPQNSVVGFCAMWFNDDVMPLWTQVIEPAIRESGYEPLRIDGKQHNGKIDDEIVASIRSSKFVVADYTGSRGGVYYEAGFAHGLGLPVVFMCREDHLKDIHFDVRQYNCIVWKADELQIARSDLKNRILATLGQGSLKVQ